MTDNLTFDPAALTTDQRDGLACVVCGTDHTTHDGPSVPVGTVDGAQVFACSPCARPQPTREEFDRLLDDICSQTAEEHGTQAETMLLRLVLAVLRGEVDDQEAIDLGRAIVHRGEWQAVGARLDELDAAMTP